VRNTAILRRPRFEALAHTTVEKIMLVFSRLARHRSMATILVAALMPLGLTIQPAQADTPLLPDGQYTVSWDIQWNQNSTSSYDDPRTSGSGSESVSGQYRGSALVSYNNVDHSTKTIAIPTTYAAGERHSQTHQVWRKDADGFGCDMQRDTDFDQGTTDPDKYVHGSDPVPMVRLQPFVADDGTIQVHWPITSNANSPNLENDGYDPRAVSIHTVRSDSNPDQLCEGHPPTSSDTTGLGSPNWWVNTVQAPGVELRPNLTESGTSTEFRFDREGSVPIGGGTSQFAFHITLEPVAGPPTADFTVTTIHPGGLIDVDGSASRPGDPQQPVLRYMWDFGGTGTVKSGVTEASQSSTATSTSSKLSWVYDDPTQKHTVTLIVSDGQQDSAPAARDINLCAPDTDAADAVEYSGLVACVEADLAAAGLPESPRQVLSTMRELFYTGRPVGTWGGWSQHRAQWNDIIPCGRNVPNPLPSMDPKLIAALQHSIVDGQDLSHIFEPLEAMECPTQKTTVHATKLGITIGITIDMPNWNVAGWGGDVGQASVFYTHDSLKNSVSWSNYVGPVAIGAPYPELVSDIDGELLHFAESGQPCSPNPSPSAWSIPLSKVMKAYYAGSSSVSVENRRGCAENALGLTESNGLIPITQAQKKYDSSIADFASVYYRGLIYGGGASAYKDDPDSAVAAAKKNCDTATALFTVWFNRFV
jgi:hypothetical protein